MKKGNIKALMSWRDSLRPINKFVALAVVTTSEPYQNSKARRTALWKSKQ
jgi:hypothetical protein